MTLIETAPNESHESPNIVPAFSRFVTATDSLNELSRLTSFGHDYYETLSAEKAELAKAVTGFEQKGEEVMALRAKTALAFAELTARRGEFIARHDEHRFAKGFHELFVIPAHAQAALVASESLDAYEDAYGDRDRRAELRGFMNELTGLMVSLQGDELRFGVPASVYDDRRSSGFHFDMILYDLNRPKDIRRAVDMKSFRRPDMIHRASRFARQIFASEELQNDWNSESWQLRPTPPQMNFPTLHAAIGDPMLESPDEVRHKLARIHDDFFATAFQSRR